MEDSSNPYSIISIDSKVNVTIQSIHYYSWLVIVRRAIRESDQQYSKRIFHRSILECLSQLWHVTLESAKKLQVHRWRQHVGL